MASDGNGHDRARVVRRYLSALDASKPGRTQARTAESVAHRMHQIDTELLSADPVQRLHLTQERIDLHAEQLRLTTGTEDLAELEQAFIRVARAYGDRYDISFSAWRQIGVDAEVLSKAGIVNHKVRPAPAAKDAPKAEQAAPAEPARLEEPAAKKAPAKKMKAVAKKAPAAAKKATAKKNGATRSVKKAETTMPAEAHLLS